MWICARCHAENKDSAPACVHCGAARAAGRFGSGAAEQASPRAPRVTRAPEAVPSSRRAPEGYQPPETQMRPRPPKRPFALPGRIIGGALLGLLPLLTALLAWRQHDALAAAAGCRCIRWRGNPCLYCPGPDGGAAGSAARALDAATFRPPAQATPGVNDARNTHRKCLLA